MKKLLITSMAAVAVSICAKAEFTDSSENFESKNIGPLFSQSDEGKYIDIGSEWSTAATPDDSVFTVTNINDIGYTLEDGNTKALAIDTSTPLMRNAVASGDASQTGYVMAGNESIFFDSLVQFTATESIPEPSSEDKLVIGLFADEDPEVNADLGALDNATNLVVISAILENGAKVGIATNVIDNIDTKLLVAPEEWHRLTIQVMNDSGYSTEIEIPGFRVFVDGSEVKVGGVKKAFYSLVEVVNNDGEGENVIKGVAFDGKGAVDDLVFTTTDPFAGGGEDPEPEPEPEEFTLKFTINAAEEAGAEVLLVVADGADKERNEEGNFILGVDVTSVVAKIVCAPGYKVTGATPSTEEGEEDFWILPVDVTSAVPGGEITCNVAVVEDSGDEPGTDPDPVTPTVDPTSGTLSAEVAGDAKADPGAIAAQVTISISAADTAAGVTAAYFKKTAEYDHASSKWVVTVALDETVVQPSADEALENVAAALTGDGTTVSITYTGNAIKPGLYYGLAAAGDLTALKTAEPASFARATKDAGVVLSANKPEGNAGFFKVVISATNPNPVQE